MWLWELHFCPQICLLRIYGHIIKVKWTLASILAPKFQPPRDTVPSAQSPCKLSGQQQRISLCVFFPRQSSLWYDLFMKGGLRRPIKLACSQKYTNKQGRRKPQWVSTFLKTRWSCLCPRQTHLCKGHNNCSTLLLCSNLLNNQFSTANLLQMQVRICCAMKCRRVLEPGYFSKYTQQKLCLVFLWNRGTYCSAG